MQLQSAVAGQAKNQGEEFVLPPAVGHKQSYETTCWQSSQKASEVCGEEPGSYRGI